MIIKLLEKVGSKYRKKNNFEIWASGLLVYLDLQQDSKSDYVKKIMISILSDVIVTQKKETCEIYQKQEVKLSSLNDQVKRISQDNFIQQLKWFLVSMRRQSDQERREEDFVATRR